MPSFSTSILLLAVAATRSASAYWLDPDSCGNNAVVMEDLVYANIMAKTGHQQLQNIMRGQGHPEIMRLADYVLGSPSSIFAASGRFDSLVRSEALTQHVTPDSVKVYCDISHLRVDTRTGQSYDLNNMISHDQNLFELCDQSPSESPDFQAFTHIRSHGSHLSTIHICPKFLASTARKEVHGLDDFLSRLNDGHPVDMAHTMDSLHLFDTGMLREFFRTSQGGLPTDTLGSVNISWEKIKQLAKQNLGGQNAESLAYFAMGSTLIEEQGWVIDADGTFGEPRIGVADDAHDRLGKFWRA